MVDDLAAVRSERPAVDGKLIVLAGTHRDGTERKRIGKRARTAELLFVDDLVILLQRHPAHGVGIGEHDAVGPEFAHLVDGVFRRRAADGAQRRRRKIELESGIRSGYLAAVAGIFPERRLFHHAAPGGKLYLQLRILENQNFLGN